MRNGESKASEGSLQNVLSPDLLSITPPLLTTVENEQLARDGLLRLLVQREADP